MRDDEKKDSTNPADDQKPKEVESSDEQGPGSNAPAPADDDIIIK